MCIYSRRELSQHMIHGQRIFNQGAKKSQWGNDGLFNIWCWGNDNLMQKNEKGVLSAITQKKLTQNGLTAEL